MSYVAQRIAEIESDVQLKRRSVSHRKAVASETTRHGKKVYYYREGSGRRIRLPDPQIVGEVAFNQAYLAAKKGKKLEQPATPIKFIPAPQDVRIGYVYFIQVGDAVKIGFSRDVAKRLSGMATALSEAPVILKTIPGTEATERYFHEHFASYRQKGEWFMLEGALSGFLAVKC